MLKKEEILLLVYFILVIFFLAGFTVIFFITYQRRKNKILQEKFEAEQKFKEELSNARVEIQEETLKNVSWELHDNIGQLLSVASMQMKILDRKIEEENQTEFKEVQTLVKDSLEEVRALSRSLNNEVIDDKGLEASVQNEIDRFNRLEVLEASLVIEGEKSFVKPEYKIILFRILQEFFSNVIKHSGATTLKVKFRYSPEYLEITAVDNGKGYELEKAKKGAGLLNMESRAKMINADFSLESSVNKGTSLYLCCPTNTKLYEPVDHHR
ncbi:histidine kinase [Christiangramia fulva]|uniref:histidine kinase n=1 Tax=Christiangramia fulva TaxID=2126553 RepID=A0A2R3Z9X4_9FLAO|nr:histidine kinase [Christiangramia fulva]AVR46972.1 histidine kinase [Christiangramia fulva]